MHISWDILYRLDRKLAHTSYSIQSGMVWMDLETKFIWLPTWQFMAKFSHRFVEFRREKITFDQIMYQYVRQLDIIWKSAAQVPWHHMVSSRANEFKVSRKPIHYKYFSCLCKVVLIICFKYTSFIRPIYLKICTTRSDISYSYYMLTNILSCGF